MKKYTLFSLLIAVFSLTLIQDCTLKRIDPPCVLIDSLSPSGATFDEIVLVKGKNFLPGAPQLYKVKIGDTILPVFDIPDANTLRFKVPKGKGGPVSVMVEMNGSSICNSTAKEFTYYYTATMVSKLMDGFYSPAGLDVDSAGNIIAADSEDWMIRVIRPSNDPSQKGEITRIIGKYSGVDCMNDTIPNAENANYGSPVDIKFDAEGNIYTAEYTASVIRRIRPDGSLERFAGNCYMAAIVNGPRLNFAYLYRPVSIAVDGVNIYFTDGGGVRMIDSRNFVTSVVYSPTPGYSNWNYFGIEFSHERAPEGPIFVTDKMNKTIKSINLEHEMQELAYSPRLLENPVAMAIDSKGNIFVADKDRNQVLVIYKNGVLVPLAGTGEAGYKDRVPGAIARFNELTGLALDEKRGVVYVSDSKNFVVRTIKIE